MSETAKQWYVVRTIGGKENKVKEYIESEIRHSHLEEYISQVLIPTEKVYTIRNGKKVSKEKVSYPGYVLIEAAFVGQIPIIIRNIPNVLGFFGTCRSFGLDLDCFVFKIYDTALQAVLLLQLERCSRMFHL